ncbi:MAG: PKD domain-containing protein, partial [Thermoplasmata archaeon]
TLVSLPSASTSGTASFQIVKYANLTANVNASVQNFAFSHSNVLNSTHDNYTVVVGVGQNVTFSALNSTYPAGTNGTSFTWVFGDANTSTVSTPTTNHTYTVASGASPDAGKLTVRSSGGLSNTTDFFVWVGTGPVTAVLTSNASASQNRSSGGVQYVLVNWGTVLYFTASASSAQISPSAPTPGVLSVASYTIVAKGFKATQNYSVGQGAYFGSNYSYQFLGAGVYYSNHTTIGGAPVYFKGWQYNVTLNVWDGTGQSGTATLSVLVADTQKPVSSFQLLNSAGKPVSRSGVVTAANLTAQVQLNGANSSDPNNGSIASYYWHISNAGNNSVEIGINQTGVKPYPNRWLAPQQKPYTVNLTVTDLNGNKGYTTQSLSVTVDPTTAVIMAANNMTGPSSLTQGTLVTYWVNITAGGGSKSVAQNVQVAFYLTSPSGTSRSYIAGTPGTVQFYNYTNGVVNSAPQYTGSIPSLAYNSTYRAEITWSPIKTGNFVLTANVTAANEYSGNYPSGPQVQTRSITVNPNPTTQLLEYVAIIVAVIVVIVAIVFLYRRRTRRTTTLKTTGRSGIERSRGKVSDDDEDDES